eukprot:217167-Rhodomonas_salina.1
MKISAPLPESSSAGSCPARQQRTLPFFSCSRPSTVLAPPAHQYRSLTASSLHSPPSPVLLPAPPAQRSPLPSSILAPYAATNCPRSKEKGGRWLTSGLGSGGKERGARGMLSGRV